MNKYLKYIRIAAIALFIVAMVIFLPRLLNVTIQDILAFTPKSPILAFLVLMGIYSLKSVIIGIPPLTILFVSAAIMFDKFWAIPISLLGLICEMTIGYWIGSRIGSEQVAKLVKKSDKLARVLAPTDRTFNMVCFVTSLLPGPLPLDIMSMLFGATRISYFRFIFFSLLGVCPGMVSWVIAGSAISSPLSKEFLIPFGIGLGISLVAFLVIQIMDKRKSTIPAESLEQSQQPPSDDGICTEISLTSEDHDGQDEQI